MQRIEPRIHNDKHRATQGRRKTDRMTKRQAFVAHHRDTQRATGGPKTGPETTPDPFYGNWGCENAMMRWATKAGALIWGVARFLPLLRPAVKRRRLTTTTRRSSSAIRGPRATASARTTATTKAWSAAGASRLPATALCVRPICTRCWRTGILGDAKAKWAGSDSNRRLTDYESVALDR